MGDVGVGFSGSHAVGLVDSGTGKATRNVCESMVYRLCFLALSVPFRPLSTPYQLRIVDSSFRLSGTLSATFYRGVASLDTPDSPTVSLPMDGFGSRADGLGRGRHFTVLDTDRVSDEFALPRTLPRSSPDSDCRLGG